MKRATTILAILLMASLCEAQRISVSPTSLILWGQLEKTTVIDVSYKRVTLSYIQPIESSLVYNSNEEWESIRIYENPFIGLFYRLLDLEIASTRISLSPGVLHRKFPTEIGTRIQFRLYVERNITKRISIYYRHQSNGFGVFNSVNPGLDNIGITIKL